VEIVIYALSFVAFAVYGYLVSPIQGMIAGLATFGALIIGWHVVDSIDDVLRARYAPKKDED
jgi:hypothetical protein